MIVKLSIIKHLLPIKSNLRFELDWIQVKSGNLTDPAEVLQKLRLFQCLAPSLRLSTARLDAQYLFSTSVLLDLFLSWHV